MKTKLTLTLIAVTICFAAHAQWDGTSSPWTQGNGTQSNPFQIETPQHLAYLSEMVSAGVSNYQNQYFLLTQDISLGNQTWVPIGDFYHPFKGHFNGGGHTIDSIFVNSSQNYKGLFGIIDNGEVCNLTCIVDINNTYGSGATGGIAARITNNTTISHCRVYGSIICNYYLCGGIIGHAYNRCKIKNCENYCTLNRYNNTSVIEWFGGIVGLCEGCSVFRCTNHAPIYGYDYVGGIAGYTADYNYNNNSYYSSIRQCGNTGNINAHSYCGGIVGTASTYDTISMCYNIGNLSSSYCCGGICYYSSNNISYSYNSGNISISSGGIGYGVSENVDKNCYNAGSITISEGSAYGVANNCTGNNYYLNTTGTYGCGSPRTEANMKSVSFPTMLNTDSVVYLMDELGINGGYPVFTYQTVYNVATDSVTNVTSYAARMNGHYSGTADSVRFMYWQQGTTDSIAVPIPTSDGNPQYQLSNLQPGTTYGYKLCVSRNGHTVSGGIATFSTHPLYTVSVSTSNIAWGTATGSGTFAYGATATLSATSTSNNYRFIQWSDGNTQNPRNLVVTQSVNLTALFGPAIYTISVSSANSAWGTVSGGGSFDYGQSTTISATASTGYHFTQWNDGNTSNPRTILVSGDMNLVASFAPNVYNVTVLTNNSNWGSATGSGQYAYGSIDTLTATSTGNYIFTGWSDGNTSNPRYLIVSGDTTITAQFSPGNCILNLSSNNAAWGSVNGGGTYPYSQTVTCTATPVAHYHFVQWNDGNTSNPRTLILTENMALTAEFAPDLHSVTVLSNNSNWGGATGSGQYAYGSIDTLRATPYTNYIFQQWNDGNSENPRYITVTNDTMFTAQFALRTYMVVLSSNNNAWGTVSGGGTYNYGQTVLCVAIPISGYHFVQWSNGNTNNPYIITADSNISLTALFAPDQYTVTVTTNDTTKGTVSGGGTYDYNQQIYIIAVPKPSYSFSQWSDGNTDAFRQLTVTQNVSYTAVFTDAYFTITTQSNNDTYGIVTGGGSYANGSNITLTAIANNGYHFVQWSDGVTDNPRTITVNSNATYYAQFAINNYTINAVTSDVSMGSVTGGGIYTYLTQVTLQATPAQNHRFVQWNDGITTNPRIVIVTADSTFTAQFEPMEQYTVTVVSDNPQRGSVSGGGTFYAGTQIDIIATALTNYTFSHWSDGNTESHRTITVNGTATYTAYFAGLQYHVNVYSNDDNMGTVSGGGSFEYGQQATVTATPSDGCRFVRWNNGVETNPYTFTVYNDVNLIATFERNNDVKEVEGEVYNVIVEGSTVHVVGADNEELRIFDMTGRELYRSKQYSGEGIDLPSSGIYLIRIGEKYSRKLVLIR